MYQFYYSPGACSMAVHAVLNELNVPFTAHRASNSEGQTKTPEFLAINPLGWVPVLITPNGVTMSEGAAILTYLGDAHKSPLFPAPGETAERALALNWLSFANASLHTAFARFFFLKKNGTTEGPLMDAAIANIARMWQHVENRLSQSEYLAGSQPTIADILVSVIANWNGALPKPISYGPNTQRLLKNISSRPAFQKALETEKVEYKAAA